MREVLSAFNSEVLRPILTILVPGMIAISSFIVGLLQGSGVMLAVADAKRLESAAIVLIAALTAGKILEDVSTHIETWFDSRRKKEDALIEKEWYDYLALPLERDQIGRGYIRSLLLYLKFEFGISLGFLVCAIGLFTTTLGLRPAIWVAIVLVAGSGWFMREAYVTHRALAKVRHELLTRWHAGDLPHKSAAARVGA